MMKILLKLVTASFVVFYGCSDSGSSNAPSHSGPATLEDLPNCTDSREGELDTLTDNGYVYRCEDGGWEFVSARLDTAATMDDLSNCTSKLDGDSVLVESENAVFQCRDGRWKKVHGLLVNVSASDDLPACTSKRDEDLAYVADEHSVYGCYDGKWKKLYALMDSVKTADDMSSCNDKREGDSTLVQDENRIYICMTKKWRLLGEVLVTEDDMKSCTENREDMRIYVKDIRKSLICRDGKWFSFKLSNLVEEEDEEAEEPVESSSSEEKWEELPSSSSQAKSSSSVASSSSVKSSSSSVKNSSSSVKSSSSVASSSSSISPISFSTAKYSMSDYIVHIITIDSAAVAGERIAMYFDGLWVVGNIFAIYYLDESTDFDQNILSATTATLAYRKPIYSTSSCVFPKENENPNRCLFNRLNSNDPADVIMTGLKWDGIHRKILVIHKTEHESQNVLLSSRSGKSLAFGEAPSWTSSIFDLKSVGAAYAIPKTDVSVYTPYYRSSGGVFATTESFAIMGRK